MCLDGLGMCMGHDGAWCMWRACMDMRVWPMDIDIDIELRSMKKTMVNELVDRESCLHTILTHKNGKRRRDRKK